MRHHSWSRLGVSFSLLAATAILAGAAPRRPMTVDDALNNAQFGDLSSWTRAEASRDVAIQRVYADLGGALGRAP